MATIKGQNLRIFIDNRVLAMATNCEVSIGTVMKEISNKDCVGGWVEQMVVSQNWNVSAECVVASGRTYGVQVEDLEGMVGTRMQIDFALADGEYNAEKGDMIVTGYAVLTDVQVTAEKRKRGTCSLKFDGVGSLRIPVLLADNHSVILMSSDGYAFAV